MNPNSLSPVLQQQAALIAGQGGVPGFVNKPGPYDNFEALNIMDLDGMPTSDYMKYFDGGKRLAFAQDHTRWDTRYWAPATTIAANAQPYQFFQIRAGDTELSLDGGTTITKDDFHTNMADAGRIEKGSTFVVHAIGIEVNIPHREFGGFTNLEPVTAAVTGTDTSSATAHMLVLDRGGIWEFMRGSGGGGRVLAEGTLKDFPSRGGFFGVMGGSTPEGYIQNGMGQAQLLREVIVLDEGRQFTFRFRALRALLSVLNVEIRPKLYGTLVRSLS